MVTSLFTQLAAMQWKDISKLGHQRVRDAKVVTIAAFAVGGVVCAHYFTYYMALTMSQIGRLLIGASQLGSPLTILIVAMYVLQSF